MNVEVKKTIVIELSKTDAFAIKTFLVDALIEMKDAPGAIIATVEKLIDRLDECDV